MENKIVTALVDQRTREALNQKSKETAMPISAILNDKVSKLPEISDDEGNPCMMSFRLSEENAAKLEKHIANVVGNFILSLTKDA